MLLDRPRSGNKHYTVQKVLSYHSISNIYLMSILIFMMNSLRVTSLIFGYCEIQLLEMLKFIPQNIIICNFKLFYVDKILTWSSMLFGKNKIVDMDLQYF